MQVLEMNCSHFIQVFNLGVRRGKYNPAHRAFYNIDAGSEAVPPMTTDGDIISVANDIVNGDVSRVAAGGADMVNPSADEIKTLRDTATPLRIEHSNLKDAMDTKQEALAELLPEADAVIKKVYDEGETFNNEEAPESMRANMREWGEVFVSIGDPTGFSGTVKNKTTGALISGADILFVEGDTQFTTDVRGEFSGTTRVIGEGKWNISATGFQDLTITQTIVEGTPLSFVAQLEPLV